MTRTKEEARAYQQGYTTGRKRAAYEFDRELAAEEREAFRREAALVAFAAIMRPVMNWGREVDGAHKLSPTHLAIMLICAAFIGYALAVQL